MDENSMLPKAGQGAKTMQSNSPRKGKWDRALIKAGKVLRVVFWLALICVIWSFKPEDIRETPFAQLTIKRVSQALLWIGGLIFCGYSLFNLPPEAGDDYWRDWGRNGVWWILLALVALIALHSCGSS
jgi:hypothetical protein